MSVGTRAQSWDADTRPAGAKRGLRAWRGAAYAAHVAVGSLHHLRLTVTDLERSRQFYTSMLGFQVAVESPPPGDPSEAEAFRILFGGVVMVRGDLLMGLRPMAPEGDRFDPDRVGLDHLSFSVASRDDLEQAVRLFDSMACPTAPSPACPRSASTCCRSKTPTAFSSSSPHW